MIRKLIALVLVFTAFGVVMHAETVEEMADGIAAKSAEGLMPVASFAAGAGNIAPANTSKFVGIKLGAGIGVVMSSKLFEFDITKFTELDNIEDAVGMSPIANTVIFGKIGLPDVAPLTDTDIGIRIGMIPKTSMAKVFKAGITSFSMEAFHVGAEVRKKLFGLPADLFIMD
ncbi:hypothetical protein ACFL6D_05245, partial [Spirochaetota bacterium]